MSRSGNEDLNGIFTFRGYDCQDQDEQNALEKKEEKKSLNLKQMHNSVRQLLLTAQK
jgi:hypothetical protein